MKKVKVMEGVYYQMKTQKQLIRSALSAKVGEICQEIDKSKLPNGKNSLLTELLYCELRQYNDVLQKMSKEAR